MSSDRFNDNQNLPPWLRDVPLPPRPRASEPAPQNAALPPAADSAADTVPADALPDWLRDTASQAASTPSPAAPPAGPQEALPDWLREFDPTAPSAQPPGAAPAQAAPSQSPDGLPDWLQDLGTSSAAPRASDDAARADLPDWLREVQEAAPPTYSPAPAAPPEPPAPPSENLPGWLADLTDSPAGDEPAAAPDWMNTAGPATPRAPEDALPGWLQPETPTPPASDMALPGWLPAEAESTAAPAPGTSQAASDEEDDTLPGWLRATPEEITAGADLAPFTLDELSDSSGQPAAPARSSWLSGEIDAGEDVPSWLQSAEMKTGPSEQPATTPPSREPSAGDVPSWLSDTTSAAPEPPAGDVPSWLSDTTPAAPEPPAGEVPSWLSDTTPAAPEPAQANSDELPDWLRATAANSPAAPGEVPAWLQDQPADAAPPPNAEAAPAWLGAAETLAPDTAPEAPSDATDTLPTWLRDSAPAASPAAPPAADDLPPWLRDDVSQPLPAAAPAGDAKLPSWLQGANADATPAEEAPAPASNGWLSEPAAAPAPADSLVGGVELPPWLRPPEPETTKEEINPTDARSLDWLTRLGAQEEEEAEAATAPAARLRPPALPQRSAAQIEAIALLEHLAADPFPTPAPAEAAPSPALWRRVGIERLLYVVLALAVVLALLLPAPNFLGISDPPSAPGAADLFAQIDKLNENDIVLVGYEWDARRSSELRPLEQAVFDHLIAHRVKLVLISTDPQGSLLLYDLRDRLGAAGYKPQGEDYILLGYKPGAELALRAVAQNFPATLMSDFQGNDASGSLLATTPDHQQRLKSPGDFSMVLVLSDEASDVQGWMEQVRPSAQHADGSYVPFAFVLPAETAPIVQPYLGQPNVLHLAGKQGALAYAQQSGAAAAQVGAETSQFRFSLLLYLALLVVGALAVGMYSLATRGRSRK